MSLACRSLPSPRPMASMPTWCTSSGAAFVGRRVGFSPRSEEDCLRPAASWPYKDRYSKGRLMTAWGPGSGGPSRTSSSAYPGLPPVPDSTQAYCCAVPVVSAAQVRADQSARAASGKDRAVARRLSQRSALVKSSGSVVVSPTSSCLEWADGPGVGQLHGDTVRISTWTPSPGHGALPCAPTLN
jgi:hypothetical protein